MVILGPDGRIFVTGPEVVRSVTGEAVDMDRLGGPEPHGRRSGVVHVVAETDEDAFERARSLTALLGDQGKMELDQIEERDLAGLLPESVKRALRRAPAGRRDTWTGPGWSCTRAGRRTSSPPWAGSAAARSG